jgi:hypothetical protein
MAALGLDAGGSRRTRHSRRAGWACQPDPTGLAGVAGIARCTRVALAAGLALRSGRALLPGRARRAHVAWYTGFALLATRTRSSRLAIGAVRAGVALRT